MSPTCRAAFMVIGSAPSNCVLFQFIFVRVKDSVVNTALAKCLLKTFPLLVVKSGALMQHEPRREMVVLMPVSG